MKYKSNTYFRNTVPDKVLQFTPQEVNFSTITS